MADVTAAEIWAEWQETSAAMGSTMTAEVSETGNGLTLTNFSVSSEQQGATTTQTIDQIELVENGDGTVSVVPSQPYSMATEIVENGQQLGTMEFLATFEGLDILASGDVENLEYAYSADTVTFSQGRIESAAGEPMPEMSLNLTLSGLDASYALSGADDMRQLASGGSLDGMTFELDVAQLEGEPGRFKLSLDIGPMTSSGTGSLSAFQELSTLMQNTAPGQPVEFPEDLALDGQIDYESLSYELQFDDPTASMQASGSNGGGTVAIDFSSSGISYALSARDAAFSMAGSQIPFPISAAAASTGFGITFPLAAAPEPSPVALSIDYTDLTVNEQLWAMFDPGQAIPRDPATVRLDVSGLVQMFVSLIGMDPTTMAGPPGELRSLDLNTLLVSVAGAELTGSGHVDFAPGAMPPQPVGSVNLALTGLNGLLDRLTGAGLLPIEQAGMVRGMAGMFGRPGAAPDSLESTIDFLPGGGITANGVPLR